MKKTRLIAGMLAASMVILMSGILQAHATEYDVFWGYTLSPKGNVWHISTVSPVGTPLFSGKDVDPDTILATIFHSCQANSEPHYHYIEPMRVILTDKFITLVFDKASLPGPSLPDTSAFTKVTGEFTTNEADIFIAVGPAFVVCFIGC